MPLQTLTQAYVGPKRREELPPAEAENFRGAVRKALGQIMSCPMGAALAREINEADHNILVVKAGPGQQNSCVMPDSGKAAQDAACYVEVLSFAQLRDKIQALVRTRASGVGPDHPAVRKFLKFHSAGKNQAHLERMGLREKPFPLAHRSLRPAHKAAHTTEAVLRERIAQPALLYDAALVEHGEGLVQSLQFGLTAYHLMDHLTPGRGADAVVVWDPNSTDAGVDLAPADRAPWMQRPPWIALAHEVIHAWRIVTGRCVFYPDTRIEAYYEEAMTVGLPPYHRCAYTENGFRQAAGQAPRNFYGPATRVLTEAAEAKRLRLAGAAARAAE